MRRLPRSFIVGALTVLALAAMVAAAFAADRAAHRDEILRNVEVLGAPLGGLTPDEAVRSLLVLEDELATLPAPVRINGQAFDLDPETIGFDVHEADIVAQAIQIGRTGTLLDQFRWWLNHVFEPVQLAVEGSVDPADLDALLAIWEEDAIANPPNEGGIEVSDGEPLPLYPSPGEQVDRARSAELITEMLKVRSRTPTSLPIVDKAPTMTPADIDEAVERARRLLAAPVTLTRTDPDVSFTFSTDQMAAALRGRVVLESNPRVELDFDPEKVRALLTPVRSELEVPPRNASFRINEDGTVSVVPGRPGTVIDAEMAAEALLTGARRPDRTAEFPFADGAEPEMTTEEALALRIDREVSSFTTFHPCCQPRVNNIHLIADIVDGALVLPGETFSLNEYVGQRTEERGFVPAPTIIQGEIVDTVGGGVSQFATTFYNAVFFGGYADVEHKPHSYYFSRYPEGHEATISWPAPDLVFLNDTDAGVLIKTSYTDTSITVTFYGNTDGRTVSSWVSDRYDFTDPATKYVPDSELDPADERVLDSGSRGWSVVVHRIITYPDRQEVEESWVVRYRARPMEVATHPCNIPEGDPEYTGEECPEPTTTTTTTEPTTTTTTTTAP